MSLYIKKSLHYEVIKNTGFNLDELKKFCNNNYNLKENNIFIIFTSVGNKICNYGDFIIKYNNIIIDVLDTNTFYQTYEKLN
jgi:hypothetical protein